MDWGVVSKTPLKVQSMKLFAHDCFLKHLQTAKASHKLLDFKCAKTHEISCSYDLASGSKVVLCLTLGTPSGTQRDREPYELTLS